MKKNKKKKFKNFSRYTMLMIVFVCMLVDDFRSISLSLLHSHFKTYVDQKRIGRVEFIPVQWHSALHGEGTGLDKYDWELVHCIKYSVTFITQYCMAHWVTCHWKYYYVRWSSSYEKRKLLVLYCSVNRVKWINIKRNLIDVA